MSLSVKERERFAQAFALAMAAAADPQSAPGSAPEIGRLLALVKVGIDRRQEPTRVINSSVGSVTEAGSGAFATVVATITFKRAYRVVALMVSEKSGITNLGKLTLSISDEDSQPIFVDNGGAASAVDFFTLAGMPDQYGRPAQQFLLERYVEANKQWTLTVNTVENGSAVYQPYVYLICEPWDPRADPVTGASGAVQSS